MLNATGRPLAFRPIFLSALVFATMLSACGGGGGYGGGGGGGGGAGGGGGGGGTTYSVGGMVTGIKGTLVLLATGANDINVTSNGPITLAAALANGAAYAFTVKTPPSNPTQKCTITHGSGVINGANVTNVAIDCADVVVNGTAAMKLRFSAAITGAIDSPLPRIATDSQGNAIAVWNQIGPTSALSSIWASRYEMGRGWSTPALIESDDTGAASHPDVAIDANGNALAVWDQSDGTCSNIMANRYSVGSGWGTPVLIETSTCDALEPRIAVTPAGDAIAVWYQFSGTSAAIWSNRYVAGTVWGTAERIESEAGVARVPQVAFDAAGNAIAIWEHFDGTRSNIRSNRYVVGTGWGVSRLVETNDAGNAQSPQLTVDPQGNALAVWQQPDGAFQRIWANRYRANGDWENAAVIGGNDSGDASNPQIVLRKGSGFTVWEQSNGRRSAVLARRYTAGAFSNAPGALTDLSGDFGGSASSPQVAIDSTGGAIAVWSQENSFPLPSPGAAYSVAASRFTVGGGWGTANVIEAANEGGLLPIDPQVAIGANNSAFSIWEHVDPSGTSLWALRSD